MQKSNFKKVRFLFLTCFAFLFYSCVDQSGGSMVINVVERPDTTQTNDFYVSNRAPLKSSMLIKLPVGSITPEGWLMTIMDRQRKGLDGNLEKISIWLQKDDNAWLAKDGKGQWGWEEVPYWLKGFGDMAYILHDTSMIRETELWINGALNSQRPDGNFGPVRFFKDGSQDFWANMIMLYCLQSYYEFSKDRRVIDLMTRYFRYQLSVPDEKLLTHYWQHMRGGDNLTSILWLYNRTGDKWLLDLAEKIHRNTADWAGITSYEKEKNTDRLKKGKQPGWYYEIPDWHNVNIAQSFREPAVFYLLSHNKDNLKASYDIFYLVRQHFGQVPGGMFGGDENSRPGYDDPRQGIETCGIVEQMNSDEQLLRITGDPFWADHVENVAFNTYPAALMPDMRSLRYLTSPNMVLSDAEDHSPGIENAGPFLLMNPFSSRCCQHNHGQGWPYFAENLWMATPDNGVCAAIYAPGSVKVKVGKGTEIVLHEQTRYPFEEEIKFILNTPETVRFPLYFRIPRWSKTTVLKINGKKMNVTGEPGKYLRVNREWKDQDTIQLELPMELSVQTWKLNHNSVSVNYGPLTFSLYIKEEYIKKNSDVTATLDSKWQENADRTEWPSYEIRPGSPWNYGLILDPAHPERSFKINRKKWPESNFPFTEDAVPISLEAKAKRIPGWKLDQYGLCAPLQDSPVYSEEQTEKVTLIPMGAARLRISAFPVIAAKGEGHRWK